MGEDGRRLFGRLSSKSLDLSKSSQAFVRDGAVVCWVCCECAGEQGARRFWVSLGAGPARVRSERTTTYLTSRTDSGVKPSMTKIGWASTL